MRAYENDLELLTNFFSGYFHEDWDCDASSPAEVAASYIRTASPQDVRLLHEAIIHYVECIREDADLEKKLFSELGCYYLPSGDRLSARNWLLSIADLLGKAV